MARNRPQDGQATVEVALLLPVVGLLAVALVEIGGLATDGVRLWHAAREAARTASVDDDVTEIRASAERAGLQPLELAIDPAPEGRVQGEPVTVTARYRPVADIPLIGVLMRGVVIEAAATMRIEQP